MKIKELQKELVGKKIDFALFYNLNPDGLDVNLFYFSGYKGIGALVVGQKKVFLMVPEMEFVRAKEGNVKRVYKLDKKRLFDSILERVNRGKVKKRKIGVDMSVMTLRVKKGFKKSFGKGRLVDVYDLCEKLREVKVDREVRLIRKACKISDGILTRCFKNFRKFKYETDVVAFLESETRKEGCSLAFNPIVASGVGGSQAHYEAKKVKLRKGFCVIDFGVRYNGYCSDTTRTVYIGRPSLGEEMMYNLLLGVQKRAISEVKVGRKVSTIVQIVQKGLGKYSKFFSHGLGHGVGVKLHELPNVTEKSKDRFLEGSVFTVEPGVYFPNRFGIRIEDDVYLGKKTEVLTRVTKDLIIV